jgi:hypothetical protein
MENVAEIRVIVDAIVTTMTIMNVKIVTSAKKRGPLMVSPLLKAGRDESLFAHTCDLSPFQPSLKVLLLKLRRANTDFQRTMKDVHYEKWQDTIDDNLLSMHKDLGMPIKLSISPHFYYQAAMRPCTSAINALINMETLEDDRGRFVWREIFNASTFEVMTISTVVKTTTYQMMSDNWGKPIARSLRTTKLPAFIWNCRRSKPAITKNGTKIFISLPS